MKSSGYIFQINVSDGGVPKCPILQGQVGLLGIEGDRSAHPDKHGGPERALCLYSLECILGLQAEGHPVFPGALGENITVADLDWPRVIPGVRLRLGNQVQVLVTRFTSPCDTITSFFAGRNPGRVSQTTHKGWARVYACVLQPGPIKSGDPVLIETHSAEQ